MLLQQFIWGAVFIVL